MSNTIIHTREFELYLSQSQIEEKVYQLGKKITEQYSEKCPVLLIVLNGAFRFAADLIKVLDFPLEIEFIRISSYEGTQSSGKMKEILGQEIDLKQRTVLIIEDIVDTGLTYRFLQEKLLKSSVQSVEMVSLLFKPTHYLLKQAPSHIGFEIPDEFVVGYGLDYNQQGRELNNIYRLKIDT